MNKWYPEPPEHCCVVLLTCHSSAVRLRVPTRHCGAWHGSQGPSNRMELVMKMLRMPQHADTDVRLRTPAVLLQEDRELLVTNHSL
jgi:hypothetical protein